MNYNKYMTVETTFMDDCPCFSFQSNKDIQNGAIVGRGALISGEEMVYEATDDYSNGMYLVANPAWNYDRHKADSRNEESFINKAGIPFRVYELKKNRYFTVGNLPKDVTLAVGDFVEFKNEAYAKATADTNLKIRRMEDVGFPYFVGQFGIPVEGDTANKYGYAVDTSTTKYEIEVV